MKPLFFTSSKSRQGGFSLVETAFSIGVLSCGFIVLAPLLALGVKNSRLARDDRESAQIATTLEQEAQQGTVLPAMSYVDDEGNTSSPSQAVYSVQAVTSAISPALSRVTLRVAPLGAPDRVRIYAVVVPTSP
jgi:hypothetical protein